MTLGTILIIMVFMVITMQLGCLQELVPAPPGVYVSVWPRDFGYFWLMFWFQTSYAIRYGYPTFDPHSIFIIGFAAPLWCQQ
jgi:hypothetical protein